MNTTALQLRFTRLRFPDPSAPRTLTNADGLSVGLVPLETLL